MPFVDFTLESAIDRFELTLPARGPVCWRPGAGNPADPPRGAGPLDVDRERGLFGRCDFLLGRRSGPFLLGSPLLAVVEAKNEDIPGNLGQCVAEMVAMRVLNERKGHPIPVVHGSVTTGAEWLFLQLEGNAVTFDFRERFLDDAARILGYLAAIGTAGDGGG
jgi:hypothetical protein